jgi:hypothetical protein
VTTASGATAAATTRVIRVTPMVYGASGARAAAARAAIGIATETTVIATGIAIATASRATDRSAPLVAVAASAARAASVQAAEAAEAV